MRAVFVGTVDVSWHCLKAVLEHDDVVAIYTMPDDRAEKISGYRSFDDVAAQHGVPLFKVTDINANDVVAHIQELAPDILYCVGWPRLVKPRVLEIPPKGCVGMHSSLLPRYRGGAPVNWGLIAGEREWGISLMYLGDGADIGDIIGQMRFDIAPTDTCRDVYDKVAEASVRLLHECIPGIAAGTAPRIVQDEADATHYRKRTPADGEIDWTRTARQLYDWTRALSEPYPGGFTWLPDGTRVTIWKAEVLFEDRVEAAAGRLLEVIPFRGLRVQCGSGQLLVQRLGLDGGPSMPAAVWAAHRRDDVPGTFRTSPTRDP